MEMEDGGRREVMVAMEVKNEVEKVKKMKMEFREFGEEREKVKVEGYVKMKLVGIK